MASHILITGASGLIGTFLSQKLVESGYRVSHLGRSKPMTEGVIKSYQWDPDNGIIDENALENIDHIIHLAGAGVADERWTPERKKVIIDSRLKSTRLLYQSISKNRGRIQSVTSASAIGYYGSSNEMRLFEETDEAGADFLAAVTKQWENEVDAFSALDIRVVKIRIGVVLSLNGGALPQLAKPISFGMGSYLGRGSQYVSWIHIEDLCRMFIKSMEDNSLSGVYNAVAPNPVTNIELTKAIGKRIHRWILPLYIPSFALKLLLGEMSVIVLGSINVSCKKILDTGFAFKYRTIDSALDNLYT